MPLKTSTLNADGGHGFREREIFHKRNKHLHCQHSKEVSTHFTKHSKQSFSPDISPLEKTRLPTAISFSRTNIRTLHNIPQETCTVARYYVTQSVLKVAFPGL